MSHSIIKQVNDLIQTRRPRAIVLDDVQAFRREIFDLSLGVLAGGGEPYTGEAVALNGTIIQLRDATPLGTWAQVLVFELPMSVEPASGFADQSFADETFAG